MELSLVAILVFATVCCAVLALYQYAQHIHPAQPEEDSAKAQLHQIIPKQSFLNRWEQASLQAGLPWKRSFYFTITGLALLFSALLVLAGAPFAAGALAVAGVAAPYLYVRAARASRAAKFAEQLPAALFLAGSVLRAGGTLLQAVDSIAAEMPDPIKSEFRLIQQRLRLQVPAHEAMTEVLNRIGVREFAAVVVGARITSEVGGNLAHIFDQIGRAILESQNARRTLQSFTTEGRMSANIIALMPFLVLLCLKWLSPGYFEPLLSSWYGQLILFTCLGTIVIGWSLIRRMVDIRLY